MVVFSDSNQTIYIFILVKIFANSLNFPICQIFNSYYYSKIYNLITLYRFTD